jgi:L-seryl-tRNA(Ser) seleniumtransferase
VDALLNDVRLAALAGAYSRPAVTRLVRAELDAARRLALEGKPLRDNDALVELVLSNARKTWSEHPRRVINATGVVLHTNLGRSPLSEAAIASAARTSDGYSDLEFDLKTGARGSRNSHISRLIGQVSGAEAGMAVNNNAAGVLLVLSALAAGKEVIVSRGEAVEIGGGFRVPDVMRQSGAKLVEVGTTNRTYARDYEAAVTEDTAAILKVHPSNFSVTGFTHSPELEELVDVAARHSVPVFNDLGSGTLIDTRQFGMEHEPMVQESVAAGAALTMFSGDKLLGGPQAGIIAGDPAMVAAVGRHPLARAVRIDKMTLAALGATLIAYLRGSATRDIPVWRMISMPVEEIEYRAQRWRQLTGAYEVKPGRSAVGGGSLPGQTLPTHVLAIRPATGPDAFSAALREHSPPVIARIHEDEVLLDPRTVSAADDAHVVSALISALQDAK